jgi:uncharacterized protein YndB with AHSA1/START domain
MKTREAALIVTLVCLPVAPLLAADPPAEIRYNAVIEAPVEKVWQIVSVRENVSRWLFGRVEAWSPRARGAFRVRAMGKTVAGEFAQVEAPKLLRLAWPSPRTTLGVEVARIDDRLTLVTLVQSGWTSDDESRHAREDCADGWLAAMMKLHRLFDPPKSDTHERRPKVPGVFVDRNLIVNGDFEFAGPGRFEGVAWGWETNSGKPSPKVHALDDKVAHGQGRSQRISHPPDWTNYAIQQFTPHLVTVIQPGRRYRLTAWVKAEGIANPAGWYRLGLWCTDVGGKPIGEPVKNEKPVDEAGRVQLNHDWRQYKIESVAPPGAARAVVIFSGHWDEGGTVWYDDVRLWEVEGK